MIKRGLYVSLLLVMLGACTEKPMKPVPIFEQLAGKTVKEKQEILRLACLNEAEKITGRTRMWQPSGHSRIPIYDPQINQMKAICRQMTDAYLTHDKEQKATLAQTCADQLEQVTQSGKASAAHIENMRQICQIMTKK